MNITNLWKASKVSSSFTFSSYCRWDFSGRLFFQLCLTKWNAAFGRIAEIDSVLSLGLSEHFRAILLLIHSPAPSKTQPWAVMVEIYPLRNGDTPSTSPLVISSHQQLSLGGRDDIFSGWESSIRVPDCWSYSDYWDWTEHHNRNKSFYWCFCSLLLTFATVCDACGEFMVAVLTCVAGLMPPLAIVLVFHC